MNLRTTCFSLVIEEYDVLNNKHITSNDICKLCMDSDVIDFFSCILHDSDVDENGELKRRHYHLVIHLLSPYCKRTIITYFSKELSVNKFIISCKVGDLIHDIRYLIHLDNKDKYQYDILDVHTNDYEQLLDILDYSTAKSILDVNYIINLCNESRTLTDVYVKLGLKTSKLYGNIIKDIWKDLKR